MKYFLVDICDKELINKELIIVDSDINNQTNDNSVNSVSNNNNKTAKSPIEDRNPTFHIQIPVYKNSDGLLEKNTEV